MNIFKVATLAEQESLKRIQAFEDQIIHAAKNGIRTGWLHKEMMTETRVYLALSEPINSNSYKIK